VTELKLTVRGTYDDLEQLHDFDAAILGDDETETGEEIDSLSFP
jgi:hypothetical protein